MLRGPLAGPATALWEIQYDVPTLLCIYQHAPTPGAPGIYRHRRYLAGLVERGWSVDLVSTPVNYMTGDVPERYRRRLAVDESIEGIDHRWVWAPTQIHRSKLWRVANYAGFAAAAFARSTVLRRPDVILVSSPPLPVAGLGPALAARFRVPWVLEVRDVWPESAVSVGWLKETSGVYRAAERFAHSHTRRAAQVIVPTPGLVPAVLRHGARSVRVITGTVVDQTVGEHVRLGERSALGIADGECVFGYVGSVGVANGLDMLLDAVKLLPADAPVRVVIAGGGSAASHIAARIDDERIDRIRLLGVVDRDRVPSLLSAMDVCLHLLRPDPVFASALPTKVLEYLASGRPFITTVAGMPERVARRSGGSYASSAAELAREMMSWVARDPQERRLAGARALDYGLAAFGQGQAVDAFETVLRSAAQGRSAAHAGRASMSSPILTAERHADRS